MGTFPLDDFIHCLLISVVNTDPSLFWLVVYLGEFGNDEIHPVRIIDLLTGSFGPDIEQLDRTFVVVIELNAYIDESSGNEEVLKLRQPTHIYHILPVNIISLSGGFVKIRGRYFYSLIQGRTKESGG